jgi:glycosyltransferase involved in cell wall biosynthesis
VTQKGRKLLIIYPYEWLAYAPTVLRLHETFSGDFDVRVIAYDGGGFCREKVEHDGIEYVRLPGVMQRLALKLSRRFPSLEKRWHFFHIARALHLWYLLRNSDADEVFASDYSGMWVAQKAFSTGAARLHFLSLEIYDSDVFAARIAVDRVASAVVQSPQRAEWLFPAAKPRLFYVQNAPTAQALPSKLSSPRTEPGNAPLGLVYCGTPLPRFGILRVLEFLREYPEFRLTIQGLMNGTSEEVLKPYARLTAEGRLVVNRKYISSTELLPWLNRYTVGFCFYDFDHLPEDQFNYRTVPSGKLFNYFAAGVPVVGIDIPGLRPVREFDAGVLIDDLSPSAIAAAVRQVQARRTHYAANCARAAAHYSFDRMVQPFRDFVLEPDKAAVGPSSAAST